MSEFTDRAVCAACHATIPCGWQQSRRGIPRARDQQEGSKGPARGHKQEVKELKNILSDVFDELWAKYPAKDGKQVALRHFKASVKSEEDCQRIRIALDNYLVHLQANTWKQPKNGSTWFNNWTDWETVEPGPAAAAPQRDRETEQQLAELRRMGVEC